MLFISSVIAAECGADGRVRKEVRDLTREEWMDYKQGLREMQKSGDYDKLAATHVKAFASIHGNYVFAQWHRLYLFEFEDTLRKYTKNPLATIPYYAAWEDSYKYGATTIDKSPIFGMYFGAGSGKGECVEATEDTVFYSGKTSIGGNHCITRSYDHNKGISGRDSIETLYKSSSTFEQFSDLLQVGYHAETHLFMNGDMAQHWSVNDPVFYSHHCGVDYLYDAYQMAHNDFDSSKLKDNGLKAAEFSQYTYGDAHANKVGCVTYVPYSKRESYESEKIDLPSNSTTPTTPNNPSSPLSTETEAADVGRKVILNKPASEEELAQLGIPPEKASKQEDWNSFKEKVAKGQGIPVVKDLLSGFGLDSVVDSMTKPKPTQPTDPETSNSSTLAIALYLLAILFQ